MKATTRSEKALQLLRKAADLLLTEDLVNPNPSTRSALAFAKAAIEKLRGENSKQPDRSDLQNLITLGAGELPIEEVLVISLEVCKALDRVEQAKEKHQHREAA